jgi:hypothetical protein
MFDTFVASRSRARSGVPRAGARGRASSGSPSVQAAVDYEFENDISDTDSSSLGVTIKRRLFLETDTEEHCGRASLRLLRTKAAVAASLEQT